MLEDIRHNIEKCLQIINSLNVSKDILHSAVKLADYTKQVITEAEETQDVSKYGSILLTAIKMERTIPCVWLLLLGIYTWIEFLLIEEIQSSN